MAAVSRDETAGSGHSARWTLTQADDTGDAHSQVGAADRTLQIYGDLAGGTLYFEGTNDPAKENWMTLHDLIGSPIAVNTQGIMLVAENPLWLRPRLAGAGATADVTVALITRGAR